MDFFNGKRTVSLKDLLLQASKLKPKELERRKDVAECQKLDTGNENKKKKPIAEIIILNTNRLPEKIYLNTITGRKTN